MQGLRVRLLTISCDENAAIALPRIGDALTLCRAADRPNRQQNACCEKAILIYVADGQSSMGR